ncbi:OLC1v1034570C1 [Oldenlandia corymbosa var. corymbosa]|uniref:OLC1v1034570C1 n=1 Tax=Oldenlandia corymbosa var. corymbosa TaxID=529605 RepID=A0AAV1CR29_OLDCO|nr:OLC1v1034570C1 [Oldenlandia corymbosa var. corymbosa]
MTTSKDQESGMGGQLKWREEESANERRQHECLRKYDKIVNQSSQPRKKSTSGAGASHPIPTTEAAILNQESADLGASSKIPSPTKAEKASVLEQTLTKHLRDLQPNQPQESSSPGRDP